MPVKKTTTPSKEDPVEVRSVSSVYYEKSVTKNLGNYESAKITVGVTLPVDPTEEEIKNIKKTISIGDDIVSDELTLQVNELMQ